MTTIDFEEECKDNMESEEDFKSYLSSLDNDKLITVSQELRSIEKSGLAETVQLSDLAMNSVFVGNSPAIVEKNMQRFIDYISHIYEDIDVNKHNISDINSDCSFDIEDALRIANDNSLTILTNLDNLLLGVMEQEYNKSKVNFQIKSLFNSFDKGVKGTVFCTFTEHGLQRFTALYPESKILFQNVFKFTKPNSEKLMTYFKNKLIKEKCQVDTAGLDYCLRYFDYASNSSMFENLHYSICDLLLEESRRYQILRLASSHKADAIDNSPIILIDIQKALEDEYSPIKEESLEDIMAELDILTGLEEVKDKVRNIAALAKIQNLREQKGVDNDNALSLHAIFYGNPGTGKTTVAHLIGRIYKSLGVLPTGHVVSVKRSDIVIQWVGGTALMTKNAIKEAKGGVLFIDEAYDLVREGDSQRDSGVEAINTLLSEMEYLNKDTCVILAGYPNDMDRLLNSNPGLSSRFTNKFHFSDYEPKDLGVIFDFMMEKQNYNIGDSAKKALDIFLKMLYAKRDKNFGNARLCRVLLQELKLIHAQRVFNAYPDANEIPSKEILQLFTVEDVDQLVEEYRVKIKTDKKDYATVGFKSIES